MTRTIVFLTLLTVTVAGCSKFLPAAAHRRTPPAAATTSSPKQPASHVAHQSDKPAAMSPNKPVATPASGAPAGTSAEHKS